jgi:hypothetical protein
MATSGIPETLVLQTIVELDPKLAPAELKCIEAAGVSGTVLAALRDRVVEPPLQIAPDTGPSAQRGSLESEVASGSCFPDCSPGYLCHEAECIQACNPACPANERCSAERVCVSRATRAQPASAPASSGGVGAVCVIRAEGPLALWTLDIDGSRIGMLGSNRHRCTTVSAGPHRVTVTLPTGGTGWVAAPAGNAATPSASFNVDVPLGRAAGLLCNAKVRLSTTNLTCERLAPPDVQAMVSRSRPDNR